MGNQRKFPKYCVLDLFIYIVWTGISETHGQIFLVSSLSKTFRTTIIFPFAPGVFVFTRAARDLVIRPIMPTDLGLESEAYLNTWFAISNLFLFFVWILWLFEDFPHSQMLYLICFIRYTRVDGDWALVSWPYMMLCRCQHLVVQYYIHLELCFYYLCFFFWKIVSSESLYLGWHWRNPICCLTTEWRRYHNAVSTSTKKCCKNIASLHRGFN